MSIVTQSGLNKLWNPAIPRIKYMEKIDIINQKPKNILFVIQNTLFVNQLTQNTLFYGIYCDGRNILGYALGEQCLGNNAI